MTIPYLGLGRIAITVFLLVKVYQGSRLALVVLLGLMILASEVGAFLTRPQREKQSSDA